MMILARVIRALVKYGICHFEQREKSARETAAHTGTETARFDRTTAALILAGGGFFNNKLS
jgi:hypothetical protein